MEAKTWTFTQTEANKLAETMMINGLNASTEIVILNKNISIQRRHKDIFDLFLRPETLITEDTFGGD